MAVFRIGPLLTATLSVMVGIMALGSVVVLIEPLTVFLIIVSREIYMHFLHKHQP